MALTVTLYRFSIQLSDIQRSVYETLDFRVAQHPSETVPYLLTRVLAFALNSREGLTFSPTGLHDPDAAAISSSGANGDLHLLIEIGNPSARKLHKATKTAKQVKVYTYKNPVLLMRDLAAEKIHRAEEIEFFSFDPAFLEQLATTLNRDNRWELIINDGSLSLSNAETVLSAEIGSFRL